MKYAFALGFMSAALLGAAYLYPSVAILLVWAGLSFGVVALGYAGVGANVFMKNENGRIAWFSKIILFPYLAYTWSIWHLCRILSREDSYNCIGEDLVVGRRLLASEVPEGFEHYVDLTAEFEDPASIRSMGSYHCLPILDAGTPSFADLDRAAEMASDGRTYIHCAQGHGRTGLFALASTK